MKNFRSKALVFLFCLSAVAGCEKDKFSPLQKNPGEKAPSTLRRGDPDPWQTGAHHNELLAYLDAQMTPDNYASVPAADQAAAPLVYQYIQQNLPAYTSITTDNINAAIAEKNALLNSSNYYSLPVVPLADAQLAQIVNAGIIPAGEKQLVMNLLSAFDHARTSPNGVHEAENAVALAHEQWNAQGYNLDNNEGYLSAVTISVAESSLNYWKNYPHLEQVPNQADCFPILGLAIADAFGALKGGITTKLDGGSWGDAGKHALVEGLLDSCGAFFLSKIGL